MDKPPERGLISFEPRGISAPRTHRGQEGTRFARSTVRTSPTTCLWTRVGAGLIGRPRGPHIFGSEERAGAVRKPARYTETPCSQRIQVSRGASLVSRENLEVEDVAESHRVEEDSEGLVERLGLLQRGQMGSALDDQVAPLADPISQVLGRFDDVGQVAVVIAAEEERTDAR